MPPLRDRKEDLPLLVEHILRDLNAKHGRQVRGVNAEVAELFQGYTWPGNVRELRNVLERAAIVCDRDLIGRAHLPADFGRTLAAAASDLSSLRFPLGTTVDAAERELILQTLAATNNKTRAAELLGISLKTLHNKLKEYEAARAKAAKGHRHAPSPENQNYADHRGAGSGRRGREFLALCRHAHAAGHPPGR